jgi:putative sterol carrier protein
MPVDDVDPATLNPQGLKRLVTTKTVDELRELMLSDRRGAVLDKIFSDMPDVFRADRAGTLSAVIHWKVGDRPDGGQDTYELVIADGRCTVSDVPSREPKLTLTIGSVDFLKVVTGNAHPVVMVMRGRLKTKGDVGLTAKFPGLFDVGKG